LPLPSGADGATLAGNKELAMPRPLPILLALLLPAAAWAHAGIGAHGAPFASGFLHPLLGPDHLLAIVAVGILAATTGGRAARAYPASFMAAMILGGLFGFEGAGLPVVEPTILASLVVLGAAIAFALRPPLPLACGTIALFGLAHGHAHGLEAPALGGPLYALGFVAATAALHGLGLAAGMLGRPAAVRALGAITGLAGLALIVG
jgi:urease accessory protein